MKQLLDGTKEYKFAASIYDAVLEPGLRAVRLKTLEVSGVGAGDRVIDVCCGTGTQAVVFAGTGADVAGIDLSEYMIAKAKPKERENLSFLQGDATDLPYENASFDCATSEYAFHEISEELRISFMNEMRRVTKKQGALIFVDFDIPDRGGFKSWYMKTIFHTIERVAGGEHYRNFLDWMSRGALHGFIERNDFQIQQEKRLARGNLAIIKVLNQ